MPVLLLDYETLKAEKNCVIFYKLPIKRSLTYTVIYRKTMLPPLNITFLHKVLDQAILKSIKSLFLHEESKNN